MRALLVAGLVISGFAAPSSATSMANVQFTVDLGCLGCGWTPASVAGSCTGLCNDAPCAGCAFSGSGDGYTSTSSCHETGSVYGDLSFPSGGRTFTLTWSGTQWSMALDDGTTGSGTVTVPFSPNCEGPGRATFTGTLGLALPEPTEVSYNDGENGFVLLATPAAETTSDAPGEGHDLNAGCTYKYSRHTGLITVVGRTHAGRHPTASASTIRCRLTDSATGVVLFDQTRTEPGPQARLEGTTAASPNRVTVCTRGEGFWGDSHSVSVGLTCKAP